MRYALQHYWECLIGCKGENEDRIALRTPTLSKPRDQVLHETTETAKRRIINGDSLRPCWVYRKHGLCPITVDVI